MKNKSKQFTFTSESVGRGHPDKLADQISDAILDAALSVGDSSTRTAIETMVTEQSVVVSGEVKNFGLNRNDIDDIIMRTIANAGFSDGNNFNNNDNFIWRPSRIYNYIHAQSSDIALGTDDFGAGDQGMMFGYACRDNADLMPMPVYMSHKILKKIDSIRDTVDFLGPDSKSQVTVIYENNTPVAIDNVVCSVQHAAGMIDDTIDIVSKAIEDELGDMMTPDTTFFINPTGQFVIGGPVSDTGLTGRKIIVDTYGGYAPHGGGAFSGKDPTKVDRSAAYMARWLAKFVVNSHMADWCLIQLAYAIGIKEPVGIFVDSNTDNREIEKYIKDNFDLTPKGIIDKFDLFGFSHYSENCIFGHFGDKDVPWEKL